MQQFFENGASIVPTESQSVLNMSPNGTEHHENGKDGRREMIENHLTNSSSTSVSDQYLPENMQWELLYRPIIGLLNINSCKKVCRNMINVLQNVFWS